MSAPNSGAKDVFFFSAIKKKIQIYKLISVPVQGDKSMYSGIGEG